LIEILTYSVRKNRRARTKNKRAKEKVSDSNFGGATGGGNKPGEIQNPPQRFKARCKDQIREDEMPVRTVGGAANAQGKKSVYPVLES